MQQQVTERVHGCWTHSDDYSGVASRDFIGSLSVEGNLYFLLCYDYISPLLV